MRAVIMSLVALGLAAAALPSFAEVNPGDTAPAIDVTEWVVGGPVDMSKGAGKTVYVVEFWATWCPPCKASIPHLSKLAERFKGQVEFVGVSDEDAATIKEFAKDGKFKYAVASDTNRNTYGAYMPEKAGIPSAYVVDKTGTVVWNGHPMGGLEAALERVLAGKLDGAKAKSLEALRSVMVQQVSTQDADRILEAAQKLLDVSPDDELALNLTYQCYRKKAEPAAWRAFVQQNLTKIDGDWHALQNLAGRLATEDDFAWRDAATAMKAAKRAAELTQGKDASVLDSLARVYFESGLLDQAIETEKKAIALDPESKGLKVALDYYTACAEVRKTAAAPPAPKKK